VNRRLDLPRLQNSPAEGTRRPESPARPALQACDLVFRVIAGRRPGRPGCLRRTYVRC